MAFCSKCGASVVDGISFCGTCGTPVQPGSGGGAKMPAPPQSQNSYAPAGAAFAPGLVARVTNILTKPQQEWGVIAGESTSTAALYTGYIVILSAIPAVMAFIQMSLIGIGMFRVGMTTALVAMIVSYVLGLGGVFLAAFVIDKLAPTFQSQSNMLQALKLVAYPSTAAWVAGVFNILPIIGVLGVLAGSLYSIYLFYLGLPVMMKTPPDKVIVYMIVSAVVIFVIYMVISFIAGSITAAQYLSSRVIG